MNFVSIATTAIILAGGLVGGSYMLSKFQLNLKKEELTRGYIVKGYAIKSVLSDIGTFSVSIAVSAPSIQECFEKLEGSKKQFYAIINDAKFTDLNIEMKNIYTNEIYLKDEKGNTTNHIENYTMSLPIQITSNNVQQIASVPQALSDLFKSGTSLSIGRIEYYVSNIDDVKDQTLALASANAKERAQTLAENCGGKVGELRRASQGVFQVTSPLSMDTSSGGMYDTDTIEKNIKAVVSVEYNLAE